MTTRIAPSPQSPLAWWTRRTPRERVLLGVLMLTLGGYLLATGVVRPLLAARQTALASIAGSDAALARLASAPEPTERRIVLMADEPVSSILTSTATVFDLTIRRIEAEADGAEVMIEDADFEDIIRWIETLERDYGLRLSTLEMDRRPEPGVVSARLGVQR